MVSVGSHNNNVLNALVSNQELAVSDIFLCHAADLICQLKGRRDGHVSPWKHTLVVRRNEVRLRELKKVDCLVFGRDQRFDGGNSRHWIQAGLAECWDDDDIQLQQIRGKGENHLIAPCCRIQHLGF